MESIRCLNKVVSYLSGGARVGRGSNPVDDIHFGKFDEIFVMKYVQNGLSISKILLHRPHPKFSFEQIILSGSRPKSHRKLRKFAKI